MYRSTLLHTCSEATSALREGLLVTVHWRSSGIAKKRAARRRRSLREGVGRRRCLEQTSEEATLEDCRSRDHGEQGIRGLASCT